MRRMTVNRSRPYTNQRVTIVTECTDERYRNAKYANTAKPLRMAGGYELLRCRMTAGRCPRRALSEVAVVHLNSTDCVIAAIEGLNR